MSRKRQPTTLAVSAIKSLMIAKPVVTDLIPVIQEHWTRLRDASIERGEKLVPDVSAFQDELAVYGIRVCTVCDTVVAVKDMASYLRYCKTCQIGTTSGKEYRAKHINARNQRICEARKRLYEQHNNTIAIGLRFEEWLMWGLRNAQLIVKLTYEFCRPDLLVKRQYDTLWFRIQCKASERDNATFYDLFGYGSEKNGINEQTHRMLVVCGHKRGNSYALWALDGAKIPADTLHVSTTDTLLPKSQNPIQTTTIDKLVARICKDLESDEPIYPLTNEEDAELDIKSLNQLKEKVFMLALHDSGVCNVKFKRGSQTSIDNHTQFLTDDRWVATQTKTHNFESGKSNAECRVNSVSWPYPHDCGIERMLEGGIVAKQCRDEKWSFWALYAHQDFDALKDNQIFSNWDEGILGNSSINTRFATQAEAIDWGGVVMRNCDSRTKWLSEPRHCFKRVQIKPNRRLTKWLLWRCTSRFIDRYGQAATEMQMPGYGFASAPESAR